MLSLKTGQIDVWALAWRNQGTDDVPDAEQREAERYKVWEDRQRFLVGRASLRRLSGRYLGRDGKSLSLAHTPHGKPFWADASGLHFNLSHSGDWVVLGFARGHEIGIDVQEETPRRHDFQEIADFAFHPDEAAALAALTGDVERIKWFYGLWVCKEAAIKAAGLGLHADTRAHSLLPLPALNTPSFRACADWCTTGGQTLYRFPLDDGHAAALALVGEAPANLGIRIERL